MSLCFYASFFLGVHHSCFSSFHSILSFFFHSQKVRNGWKLDHMTFVVLSCLGTAFLAHFNAPTFFHDLKHKSVARFRTVVSSAFGISTAVFALMMAFGFGTFGSATAGNVFVNYNKVRANEWFRNVNVCVSIPRHVMFLDLAVWNVSAHGCLFLLLVLA